MDKKYVLAKLRDCNGDTSKRWCVFYYVDGDRKRIWLSQKLTTRPERYKEAEKIIKEINRKLRSGIYDFEITDKNNLSELLKRALDYKKTHAKPRSIKSFDFIIRVLKEWLKKNNLQNIYISKILRQFWLINLLMILL